MSTHVFIRLSSVFGCPSYSVVLSPYSVVLRIQLSSVFRIRLSPYSGFLRIRLSFVFGCTPYSVVHRIRLSSVLTHHQPMPFAKRANEMSLVRFFSADVCHLLATN